MWQRLGVPHVRTLVLKVAAFLLAACAQCSLHCRVNRCHHGCTQMELSAHRQADALLCAVFAQRPPALRSGSGSAWWSYMPAAGLSDGS